MAKKILEESLVRIKKSIETNKEIIGTESVMNAIRSGEVQEVFLSANIPETTERDIRVHAEISNVTVTKLKQANDDLGVVCKKPFDISVMAIKK